MGEISFGINKIVDRYSCPNLIYVDAGKLSECHKCKYNYFNNHERCIIKEVQSWAAYQFIRNKEDK